MELHHPIMSKLWDIGGRTKRKKRKRYIIYARDAPSRHCGGVALFYRLTPHFVVEAVERCGPNVIVFQVATGERRWHVVGAYIAP